jgi:UDP-N-acetylmuramoyl-L-alanyl-D-glutamate--2,6-diaminopimelate ligase
LKLTELTGSADPNPDLEITGLSADSRTVRRGFLFAALPGTRQDGRAFAADAVAHGAVAILTDDAEALALTPASRERVAILVDPNPHRRLACLAACFHGRQPRTIAAVTGTNGKTSVVHFTREIWTTLGLAAASLGTLGLITADGRRPGSLTTPDPVALHDDLATLAGRGIDRVAIEASSHGLHQCRLDGLTVASAAFTNLTRDHLDYHGDMMHYRAAKDRLFAALLAPGGTAVLNADSGEFARLATLCHATGHPVLTYGSAPAADLCLLDCKPQGGGQRLLLDLFGQRRELVLPLAGGFQAMNALAALGLVVATGIPVAAAAETLSHLTSVPGRLEFVAALEEGGAIVVDYAHTPDALATVLTTLRPHAQGRLIALFGCGGDRDAGKRPLMGQAAARLADRVYVTERRSRPRSPISIPATCWSLPGRAMKPVRSSAAKPIRSTTPSSPAKSPERDRGIVSGGSDNDATVDRWRCRSRDRRTERIRLGGDGRIDRYPQSFCGRLVRGPARSQS